MAKTKQLPTCGTCGMKKIKSAMVGYICLGCAGSDDQLKDAAPQMLEALRWVASVVKHKTFCPAAEQRGPCDCGLHQVFAAIAAAEGTTGEGER